MTDKYAKKAAELVKGAVDVHIHTGPDVFPRLLTDVEAAAAAREAEMKAILIKSHVTITADRARIASSVTGFPVYGAVTLNLPVGGFNPQAVEMAARMGAKEVWMPTIHAAAYLKNTGHVPMFQSVLGSDLQGLTVFDGEGNILPEVDEVLKLTAENELILGTGHLSVQESFALVPRAVELGVKTILITHPLAPFINFTGSQLREIIALGACYLEHKIKYTPGSCPGPEEIYQGIIAAGPERCIMATDSGQIDNDPPVAVLTRFIKDMLQLGISEGDIRQMVQVNPADALGIM